MSQWTPAKKTECLNTITTQQTVFDTAKDTLLNEAQKTDASQSAMDVQKANMNGAISAVRTKTNEVSAIITVLKNSNTNAIQTMTTSEQGLETLKNEVEQAKTLNMTRKEQVEALRKKYDGNLHSSWLGLWRPMADTSRTGILVASVALGLLAIASLVYWYIEFIPGTAQASTQRSFGALFGGFRKLANKRSRAN